MQNKNFKSHRETPLALSLVNQLNTFLDLEENILLRTGSNLLCLNGLSVFNDRSETLQ